MMTRRYHAWLRVARSAFTVAAIATCLPLAAGPLDPPAGPVTAVYKNLGEVEPRIPINATNTPGNNAALFVISQPGSYYLTGNITGVASKNGIDIACNNVTLDLNGFTLQGVADSLSGIRAANQSLQGITIRNGTISNWEAHGIDFMSYVTQGCQVIDINAHHNLEYGILNGSRSVVTGCTATQNLRGIAVGTGSCLTHCVAADNSSDGIATGSSSTVTDCAASLNGADGIVVPDGAILTNCASNFNTGSGFSVGNGSIVRNVLARCNKLDGIVAPLACIIRDNDCTANGYGAGDGANIHTTGSDNRIEGNNCVGADRGIQVASTGSIILRNSCTGNTTNWVIAAGNAVAPIVSTTSSTAVNGSTYAGSLASTDPNANFSY